MKILGKTIGLLFVLLFLISLPLSLLFYDVGGVVFNPPLVKSILTDVVLESDLIPAGVQWYAEQRAGEFEGVGGGDVGQPNLLALFSFLDMESWQAIRAEALPDEMAEQWISTAVDAVYFWLDSDAPLPEISWSLSAFKSRLESEHGRNVMEIVFSAMPPCSEDQVADFKATQTAGSGEVPFEMCQFPDPWLSLQVDQFHRSLGLVIAQIPDTFDLTETFSQQAGASDDRMTRIKLQIQFLRSVMKWVPLIPAVILLLVLLFAVRSLKELGRWWGIPLLIGGGFSLLVSMISRTSVLGLVAFGPLGDVPVLVRDELVSVLARLTHYIFQPLMWQAVVIVLLGTLLLVVGALVKPKVSEIS